MATKGVWVIDDEFLVRQELCNILLQAGYKILGESENGDDMRSILETDQLHFILMDIHFEGKSYDGIDLAAGIREHSQIPILFLTSMGVDEVYGRRKLISNSRELHKPPKADDIKAQLMDLETTQLFPDKWGTKAADHIFLPTGKTKNLRKFLFDEITYLEADNNTAKIFLSTSSEAVRIKMSLKEVREKLPESFVKVNRSYIVNMLHVSAIEKSSTPLVYVGKKEIGISDSFRQEIYGKLE